MKRLGMPIVLSIAIACVVEFLISQIPFFENSFDLWNLLFCSMIISPILLRYYIEDSALRGKTVWNRKNSIPFFFVGAAQSLLIRGIILLFQDLDYGLAVSRLLTGDTVLEFVVLVFATPLLEELLFRGLLFERLKEYTSVTASVCISAIMFGLYHGNLAQGIYGFIMGIVLATAMHKRRTILAPWMIHMGANTMAVFLEHWILT